MRVICRAGKWTEITVIPSHVFFTLVKLESKNFKWFCCLLIRVKLQILFLQVLYLETSPDAYNLFLILMEVRKP